MLAGLIALIGHWVIRANAKLQARIARETAERGHQITMQNAKLQARLTANIRLAEMRQAWINSLRDDMASFQSYGVTPSLEQAKQQEFYRLGTRIELFMNPEDRDYDRLQDGLYAFLTAKTIEEKYGANAGFVAVCQRILKREWNVLRDEIRSVSTEPAPSIEAESTRSNE
jgi:vacuolar-type H+-ATPase subunit E/Vma4